MLPKLPTFLHALSLMPTTHWGGRTCCSRFENRLEAELQSESPDFSIFVPILRWQGGGGGAGGTVENKAALGKGSKVEGTLI